MSAQVRFSPVVARPEAFLDAKTGLMIMADDLGEAHTHEEALKLVAECRCLGHSDWGLVTVEEGFAFVDYTRCDPAADPLLKLKSTYYWTSTRKAGDSSCAWAVDFLGGLVGIGNRSARCRVRAVRDCTQQAAQEGKS